MKYIKEYKDIDWDDWEEEEEEEEEYPNNKVPNDFKNHVEFYNFLKQYDIVDKFKEELLNNTIGEYLKRYDDPLESCLIDHAFYWDESYDGDSYWRKIEDDWIGYISELKNNNI